MSSASDKTNASIEKESSGASSASVSLVKVQLAIYDLSQGMAKALSAQLLGPDNAIDVVPHTGVLVYGKEYFFGSTGLSVESPTHFRTTRGIQPLQIVDMGTTHVSQTDFEAWCRHQSTTQFRACQYNLFDNNCNHFSQCALTEGLQLVAASAGSGSGSSARVPQWILDVPRKVLASPFGQLARPMLENMQVSGGVPIFVAPVTEALSEESEDRVKTKLEKLHPRQSVTPSPTPLATSTSSGSSSSSSQQPPKSKFQKTSHHSNNNNNNNNKKNNSASASSVGQDPALQALAALQQVWATNTSTTNNTTSSQQQEQQGSQPINAALLAQALAAAMAQPTSN